MQAHESLIELVGNTPLVRLRTVTRALGSAGRGAPAVLAKVEYFNPGGSVKDRIALRMVEAAEASGALRPGGTIIEPTSGNTGVGLAIVAAEKGYRCVFVCPDKVAQDKISVLRAYGAEVVVCPGTVSPDHPDSYYSVSTRLARETPGGWKPDQYSNPENPASHYHFTGPEIWAQTDGKVSHFVAGIGTGGTITGAGRYLKEASQGKVKVIGADPEGSVYSGGTGRPYLVEGVGEDIWPATYDPAVCDEVIAVSDAESFLMTRRLAREEALLVGGSGGLAVVAALRAAATAGPDDVVVVLLPDGGRGYLSKIFNDDWMADYGFLTAQTTEPKIAEVLARKQAGLPQFVHTHPDEQVATAISILREYNVSQLPVMKTEPPVMAAEVIGSVVERDLLDALVSGRASPKDPVGQHMSPPLPMVGSGEPVSRAVGELEKAGAAVVLVDGRPAAMITAQDVLTFLAGEFRMTAHGSGGGAGRPAGERRAAGGFETLAIHAGQDPDPRTGAVVPPIYQVSTYAQDGVGGLREGYEYSRTANPTRTALEECLATLEGGARALAFASGMAAEDCLLRTVCAPGDHVLIPHDAYGGTYRLFDKVLSRWQVSYRPVHLADSRAVRVALAERPVRAVWVETPTNPLLSIVDITALVQACREAGALLVVDNTFASPYLQNPLALGADAVVHSTTKYLGGHSDVIGGAVVVADPALGERLAFQQNATGGVAAPFDAWLTLRGIRTLAVRMDRHGRNASRVAEMLARHPDVTGVLYPGLPGHPGHEVAVKQMRGFGGMVAFRVRGGEDAAVAVCGRTRVFTLGESLGGVESLIEHPARMTHASATGSPLEVPGDLVRLSVGIETADDLLEDLRQALTR